MKKIRPSYPRRKEMLQTPFEPLSEDEFRKVRRERRRDPGPTGERPVRLEVAGRSGTRCRRIPCRHPRARLAHGRPKVPLRRQHPRAPRARCLRSCRGPQEENRRVGRFGSPPGMAPHPWALPRACLPSPPTRTAPRIGDRRTEQNASNAAVDENFGSQLAAQPGEVRRTARRRSGPGGGTRPGVRLRVRFRRNGWGSPASAAVPAERNLPPTSGDPALPSLRVSLLACRGGPFSQGRRHRASRSSGLRTTPADSVAPATRPRRSSPGHWESDGGGPASLGPRGRNSHHPIPGSRRTVASRDRSERVLLLALVLTFGTAIAFIVAIVGELEDGVAVHEIAGTLLLAFLLVGLAIAVRIRSVDRRPLVRVAIAIGALVAAGITGAGLATGTIPMGLAGLPLGTARGPPCGRR